MAEYLVTDSDMTKVADAIRAKGGTTEALAWPDGYKTAIDAIQTGGGSGSGGYSTIDEIMQANGYTTQSENIAENQIRSFKSMLMDAVSQIEMECGYSTNQEIVPYFNDAESKIAFVIQ